MKLPSLKIGSLIAPIPIIQGGMAVRISTAPLAAAVANQGGIGVIGGAGLPIDELIEQVKKAKALSPKGLIAVNLMYVAQGFIDLVDAALENGADLLITGAGFSRDVFKSGKKYNKPIVSVVSSVKAAVMAEKCGADAIIVEGKEAGGHLGTDRPLLDIFVEIRAAIKSKIPVIAAGGITCGKEIAEYIKRGASGVQMATRFVLSKECEVSDKFKQVYLSAKEGDTRIFHSPVGLPGRALTTKFLNSVLDNSVEFFRCGFLCMKNCSMRFCIIESLMNAQKGDVDHGIVFAGENVWKIKNILSVKDIMHELVTEAEANLA